MELLLANAIGTTRRETLNGREYIVAPATLIVPGVLNGSRGALYYPPEEVSKGYDAWNGMPGVVNHPVVNGKNVSARIPVVLNSSAIGTVFNSHIGSNGELKAEVWFDVLATKRVDNRVYVALMNNQPIELSTGLFTENTPTKGKCPKTGASYDYIARNYRPDHLAILPDQKGACSLRDGCGVLVNAHTKYKFKQENCPKCGASMEGDPDSGKCNSCGEMWGDPITNTSAILPSENPTMALTPERRTEIVNVLCTNCACWKGKNDKEVLNKFDDEKLEALEKHAKEEAAKDAVVNTVKQQFGEITTNALMEKIQEGKTAIEKTKAPVVTPTPAPAPTPVGNKAMTMSEWMAAMPSEAQATWNNVVKIEQDEKAKIVTFLTANISDAAIKAAEVTRLGSKTLADLQEKVRERQLYAPPAPTPVANNGAIPNIPLFVGANPPVTNTTPVVKKQPLIAPTINYEQLAKEQRLGAK